MSVLFIGQHGLIQREVEFARGHNRELRLELRIHPVKNCIEINGVMVVGRLRWEAACLSLLIRGEYVDFARACGAAKLQSELAARGQRSVLNRKQLSRLWDSLQAMFELAGCGTEFAQRFAYAPRNRTVGPWWWCALFEDVVHAVEGEEIRSTSDQMILPGLAVSGGIGHAVDLCRQLLIVHGTLFDGNHAAALPFLDECALWREATPELHGLRLLRSVEAKISARDFVGADRSLIQLKELVDSCPLAQIYLGSATAIAEQRVRYAQSPMDYYAGITLALRPAILQAPSQCHLEIDSFSRSRGFSLAALCERRWIEEFAETQVREVALVHVRLGCDYSFAAIYGFLVNAQYEYVQYACANLAYLLQQAYLRGVYTEVDDVFAWYGLAQAWLNRFELPDNTIWEYIFLGDFWLYSPEVRSHFSHLHSSPEWDGLRPDQLAFYQRSWTRAQELTEPRQMVHAALNLYHFARIAALGETMASAQHSLHILFDAHPQVKEILLAEGYVLPDD